MRYAMVGGGVGSFIGAVHRKALSLDGLAELHCGVFGSSADRSIAGGAAHGIPAERSYGDIASMLASVRDEIDFVVIVTPNDSHYGIAKACFEAGVHVVCDKPLAVTSGQARELGEIARTHGLLCAVTYNYSGYPMVRQAAAMVAGGEIGAVRRVQVEYFQGWLATRLESEGQKQASWRTDPSRAGIGGALGDIGTHAEHLARFVTGLEVESLCADANSFVGGRALDDDAGVLMRFRGGAKGSLTASQICVGEQNGLVLRVYGEIGGLIWRQEQPEALRVTSLEKPEQILVRGGVGLHERAQRATRLPGGHPEGFIEAFANIYAGAIDQILAGREGRAPSVLGEETPLADDGARGVRFVELAVESSRARTWIDWSD